MALRSSLPGYTAIIGLAGGIASGKSNACSVLASFGALTVDADKIQDSSYDDLSLGRMIRLISRGIRDSLPIYVFLAYLPDRSEQIPVRVSSGLVSQGITRHFPPDRTSASSSPFLLLRHPSARFLLLFTNY